MAHTARDKEDTKELFDDGVTLMRKVKKLANTLRNSEHAIAFTGAGISTSAGIADFRSGVNTCLDTGAGKWEADAHRKKTGKTVAPGKRIVSTLKAYPTYTHMALKTLLERGVLKFLVSQNTDGLHRRSGVPAGMLAELHGNGNLETCPKCHQSYLRDFRTRNNKAVHKHETGRECDDPTCNGKLRDTIINFGENLPEKELSAAENHAARADVCLALGSSLTVTPAADGPAEVGRKKNADLFIFNLQPTPLDGLATERMNGKTDDVMRLLMKELGIEVPAWRLTRGVSVEVRDVVQPKTSTATGLATPRVGAKPKAKAVAAKAGSSVRSSTTVASTQSKKVKQVVVSGFDPQTLLPFALFESVTLYSKSAQSTAKTVRNGPFVFNLDEAQIKKMADAKDAQFFVKIEFMKHYNEPALILPVNHLHTFSTEVANDLNTSIGGTNRTNNGITAEAITESLQMAQNAGPKRFEIQLDFSDRDRWIVRDLSESDASRVRHNAFRPVSNKQINNILESRNAPNIINEGNGVVNTSSSSAITDEIIESDEEDETAHTGFLHPSFNPKDTAISMGPVTFQNTGKKPLFPGDDVPLNPSGTSGKRGLPFGGALPFTQGMTPEEQRLTQTKFVTALNSMNGLTKDLAQLNGGGVDNMMLRMS